MKPSLHKKQNSIFLWVVLGMAFLTVLISILLLGFFARNGSTVIDQVNIVNNYDSKETKTITTNNDEITATPIAKPGGGIHSVTSSSSFGGYVDPEGYLEFESKIIQRYRIYPDDGYYVSAVILNNVALTGSDFDDALKHGYWFFFETGSHTLHVVFSKVEYVITAVSVTNEQQNSIGGQVQIDSGTLSDNASEIKYYQDNVNLTAYTNTGFIFEGWYNDPIYGTLVSSQLNYSFIVSQQNQTFYARWVSSDYVPPVRIHYIIPTAGANGSISPPSTIESNRPITQHFTFTPNTGYFVNDILINSVPLAGSEYWNAVNNGYTFVDAVDNNYITATFKPEGYYVNLNTVTNTFESNAGGNVKIDGGELQNDVSGYVFKNNTTTIEAVKNKDYEFEGWYDAVTDGTLFSTEPTVTFTLTSDTMLYARFLHKNFVNPEKTNYIIPTAGPGGIISPNTLVEQIWYEPITQTFILTPDENYRVASIQVNGDFVTGQEFYDALDNGYTFTNVINDNNIIVMFELIEQSLILEVVTETSLSPLGGELEIVGVDYGTSLNTNLAVGTIVNIRAIANNGYIFHGWYDSIVGGNLISLNANYSFTMPNNPVTYYAVFKASSVGVDASVEITCLADVDIAPDFVCFAVIESVEYGNKWIINMSPNSFASLNISTAGTYDITVFGSVSGVYTHNVAGGSFTIQNSSDVKYITINMNKSIYGYMYDLYFNS